MYIRTSDSSSLNPPLIYYFNQRKIQSPYKIPFNLLPQLQPSHSSHSLSLNTRYLNLYLLFSLSRILFPRHQVSCSLTPFWSPHEGHHIRGTFFYCPIQNTIPLSLSSPLIWKLFFFLVLIATSNFNLLFCLEFLFSYPFLECKLCRNRNSICSIHCYIPSAWKLLAK